MRKTTQLDDVRKRCKPCIEKILQNPQITRIVQCMSSYERRIVHEESKKSHLIHWTIEMKGIHKIFDPPCRYAYVAHDYWDDDDYWYWVRNLKRFGQWRKIHKLYKVQPMQGVLIFHPNNSRLKSNILDVIQSRDIYSLILSYLR